MPLTPDECRRKAQAHLDAMSGKPIIVYPAGKLGPVRLPMPGLETSAMRETRDLVFFTYLAVADPATGERAEMGGNIPLAVDRRTGEARTASLDLLHEHWPESIASHAWRPGA